MADPWHYDTMRDADGNVIWHGQYDLYALWSHFGIPDDLSGQSMLDVGTATGFFAFECERRGAGPVVATELADLEDWDTALRLHWIETPRPFDWWVPTKCLVPVMLRAAGFRQIEEVSDFTLAHADGTRRQQACWHATVSPTNERGR